MHANIAEQRAALIAGDGDTAFGYASAGYSRAVRRRTDLHGHGARRIYAPLLTARYVEFLRGRRDRRHRHRCRCGWSTADNTVRVALYTMERQSDGSWRIAGCRIAPSTVASDLAAGSRSLSGSAAEDSRSGAHRRPYRTVSSRARARAVTSSSHRGVCDRAPGRARHGRRHRANRRSIRAVQPRAVVTPTRARPCCVRTASRPASR